MKKSIGLLLAAFLAIKCGFAFDSPYFKGYAGFMGDLTSDPSKDHISSKLFPQGYFGGQLDLGEKLIIRSEFLVQGFCKNLNTDLLGDDVFASPIKENSVFRIQELSALYRFNLIGLTHYFSAFMGEYEPIGSDIFLQRHLGIKKFNSRLTESWHGLNGASINRPYSGGLSYTLHLDAPFVAGISFYRDFYQNEQEKVYNADIRLAGSLPLFTFDASLGLGIPRNSRKVSEKKYLLAAQYLVFRAGFSLLIGSPSDQTTFFIQGGFSNLIIDPDAKKTIKFGDANGFSLLFEPRIELRKMNLSFSVFSLNSDNVNSGMYTYLLDALGFDIHISTNQFHLGSSNFTLGLHTTFGLNYKDSSQGNLTFKSALDNWDDASDWEVNFYLSPYAEIPIQGGEVASSFTFRLNRLFEFEENWASNVHFRFGFRSEF